MACADKAHKVEGDGGARACFRMPHSRSRYIDPGRPPAADGGLRSQYPDLVLGPRQPLDCRQLRQAVRRVSTRYFDTRSKASIDLVASVIKPGHQSLT